MKNAKISAFAKKASEELLKLEAKIQQSIIEDAASIDEISLEIFSNENPYEGETQNKIFFTYSNHYRGNSGVSMRISQLHNPHLNYEDRGYIKGVATDLNGYLKIRSLTTEFEPYNSLYLYTPKFTKSKHSDFYKQQVAEIKESFNEKLKLLMQLRVVKNNEAFKAKTGLSLGHYIENI